MAEAEDFSHTFRYRNAAELRWLPFPVGVRTRIRLPIAFLRIWDSAWVSHKVLLFKRAKAGARSQLKAWPKTQFPRWFEVDFQVLVRMHCTFATGVPRTPLPGSRADVPAKWMRVLNYDAAALAKKCQNSGQPFKFTDNARTVTNTKTITHDARKHRRVPSSTVWTQSTRWHRRWQFVTQLIGARKEVEGVIKPRSHDGPQQHKCSDGVNVISYSGWPNRIFLFWQENDSVNILTSIISHVGLPTDED